MIRTFGRRGRTRWAGATRAVEVLTWVTAEAIGTAGGAAGAGALGQHIAGWTPFVVASALLAIPAALALAAASKSR